MPFTEYPGFRVTQLPAAGREQMLSAAALNGSAHWSEAANPDGRDEQSISEQFGHDGWHVIDLAAGVEETGMTAQRGTLFPGEYVDHERLRRMVEQELGFTYEHISSVYRQGPLSASQRELRGQIDARLLALSLSGGLMIELAKALGWQVKPGDENGGESCWKLEQALARARAAEAVTA